MNIGPRGTFSDGKINADDQGDLQIAIGHDEKYVSVYFGTVVKWLAMPPWQARDIAAALVHHADQIERKTA